MPVIDPTSRAIINGLQGGFPLTPRPFRDAGLELGLSEGELIEGVRDLVGAGRLSRFGPLWNAELLGGDVCLAAIAVPPERFDEVAEQVNAHPEIAHNYERTHALNMWFVVSAEDPRRIAEVIAEIEAETGLGVHAMPKMHEFFVGFRVEV
ncbi:Lrp/AsnC family transcriptional regulator [Bradyrhizobium sediminis]|uniref:Siroheme decarboxylase NirG subunit n=1 Tax=Bradyrhizobium sediminis TaxID=2840469 RepID=A0A975RLB9_9BRAD|nr:Lrp/AsnC family transcriptional regulator [Bradyrhizobium sediminis]QWG11503.1 Lrp/AsnC family transcriptional regulator [Bradyrhizobium sediminis]